MLTPAQAAEIAKVSRPTIMTAIKSGKLQAKRNNKSWQIVREDLDDWMKGRSVTASSSYMKVNESLHEGELAQLRTDNAVLAARLEAKDEVISVLRQQLEQANKPFWKRFL